MQNTIAAEVQAEAFMEIVEGKLANKQDILYLKRDIKELEVALKKDIEDVKRDVKELEIRLKHDLTLRLGGMMVTGIVVVAALVKLL